MKVFKSLRNATFLCLALSVAAAHAQDLTFSDAVAGKVPLSIKPTEITDDYKPVKLIVNSTTSTAEVATALYHLSAAGGPNMQGTAMKLLEIVPILWTKGESVKIAGLDYTIFYGFDPDAYQIETISRGKNMPEVKLKLKLIKSSEVASIVPLPEWSKERYVRSITPLGPQKTAMIPHNATANNNLKPTIKPNVKPATGEGSVAVITPNTQTSHPTAVLGASVKLPELKAQAAANATQIATAMVLYAQDYDETFPYVQSTATAKYVTFPYVKNATVWRTMNPVRSGEFRFNISLGGSAMTDIANPAETPVAYDPFAWPDGMYLVAFADSHARFVTPQEWATIQKNIKMKLKKHGKPLPSTLGVSARLGG